MKPIGGVKHDPRPLDLLPRTLLGPRDPRQLDTLLAAELDLVTGRARHRHINFAAPAPTPSTNSNSNLRTALLVPDGAALRRRLARRAALALRPQIAQAPGAAQADRGLDRVGQRQAAEGRRALGPAG